MARRPPEPPRVENRKAYRDYEVLEKLEAGIQLTGSEVKSLRAGRCSIDESYGFIEHGQLNLLDMYIAPYAQAGYTAHDPNRPRRLLAHRAEIRKWAGRVAQRGCTIVPLELYFNERGMVKLRLGLATGKTHADRREDIKKRDAEREMARAMRRR